MKHARADYQERIVDKAELIPEDEPVMLFRAQDVLFIHVLMHYAHELDKIGADEDMVLAVQDHIETAREWRRENQVKVPDKPDEPLSDEIEF